MMKAIALAWSLAMAFGAARATGPRVVTMPDLTVPRARLPDGCVLSPAHRDVNTMRGAPWAGLPIPTNPWTGTDRRTAALIRDRMEGPARAPDGPPLDARERSQFQLHLADAVEEAYAAIYMQAERERVVVYALRFAAGQRPLARQSGARGGDPKVVRVSMGSTVAVVSGDGGACFQAVAAYVKSHATEGE